jgi:Concanavalin A-like lectin/glucanases superfamily
MRSLLLFALCSMSSASVIAREKKPEEARPKAGLQFRYTFANVKKDQVADVSGNAMTATLVKGKVVREGDEHALRFEGAGHLSVAPSARLDPSRSPIVLGAWIDPTVSKGVIVAIGGETSGLSLYLKDGVPTFAVRSKGKLTLARAERRATAGRWTHLMGVLGADGRIRVWVDGRASGDAAQAELLGVRPKDGLSIGADTGTPVGDYPDEQPYSGRLRDVRFYRGVPTEKELRTWSAPGR